MKWDLTDSDITVIGARLRNYYNLVCETARQLNNCFSSILLLVIFNIFIQVITHTFLIDWELHNMKAELVWIPTSVFTMLTVLIYLFAITYAVDLMSEEEFNLLPILRNFILSKETHNMEFIQLINEINGPTWKIAASGFFQVNRGIIIQVNFQKLFLTKSLLIGYAVVL